MSDTLSSGEMDNIDRERVAWGALVFDRIRPQWFIEIDIPQLHMGIGSRCIIGQTFGNYAQQMGPVARLIEPGRATEFMADELDFARYGATRKVMVKHGLWTHNWGRYGILKKFWVEEIEPRLRAHRAARVEEAFA